MNFDDVAYVMMSMEMDPPEPGDFLHPDQMGEASPFFWSIWNKHKSELKEWGFHVSRENGNWIVRWSYSIPGHVLNNAGPDIDT